MASKWNRSICRRCGKKANINDKFYDLEIDLSYWVCSACCNKIIEENSCYGLVDLKQRLKSFQTIRGIK